MRPLMFNLFSPNWVYLSGFPGKKQNSSISAITNPFARILSRNSLLWTALPKNYKLMVLILKGKRSTWRTVIRNNSICLQTILKESANLKWWLRVVGEIPSCLPISTTVRPLFPAWTSKRYIENPIQCSSFAKQFVAFLIFICKIMSG